MTMKIKFITGKEIELDYTEIVELRNLFIQNNYTYTGPSEPIPQPYQPCAPLQPYYGIPIITCVGCTTYTTEDKEGK